jgi:hypothetical protein
MRRLSAWDELAQHSEIPWTQKHRVNQALVQQTVRALIRGGLLCAGIFFFSAEGKATSPDRIVEVSFGDSSPTLLVMRETW